MITHLLVDYGEVMSQPQPAGVLRELAQLSGLPTAELSRRYWHHRPDYDRGQTSEAYWSTVLQRSFAPDEPLLQTLVATDVEGWLHLNSPTLRILVDAARSGTHLALLSNAPHPQADAMARCSWARLFAHRLYSCRLGIAKPEPSIFEHALDIIGAPPGTDPLHRRPGVEHPSGRPTRASDRDLRVSRRPGPHLGRPLPLPATGHLRLMFAQLLRIPPRIDPPLLPREFSFSGR